MPAKVDSPREKPQMTQAVANSGRVGTTGLYHGGMKRPPAPACGLGAMSSARGANGFGFMRGIRGVGGSLLILTAVCRVYDV